MSIKNAAVATGVVVSAMAGLVVLHSNTQVASAAAMPATGIDLGIYDQLAQVRIDVAREHAEASRQEVPAILAARAEAERIAAEQARLAAEAEAAAKAEAEAAAAAAQAQAEAEQAAAAATRKAAPKPSQAAPAAPAPAPAAAASGDRGISTSAYTGRYYNPAYEATRQCIVRKESGGNYGIVGSGTYFGAYQFSRSTGDATARLMGRPDLVGRTVNTWTRAEQDEAFWTLWNNGAGRGHWPTARGC